MAKVGWSAGIDYVSGALSKPSKLCNPSTKEPSAAQIKAKERFAKVSAAVRAILAGTSEQKTQLEAEYKAQHKYGSLFGYAMHKLNSDYDADGEKIGD